MNTKSGVSSWEQTKPLFEAWGIKPPENPERYEYGFGLEPGEMVWWLEQVTEFTQWTTALHAGVAMLYARPIPVPEPVTVELPPPPSEWGKVKVCRQCLLPEGVEGVGYWAATRGGWESFGSHHRVGDWVANEIIAYREDA